MASKKWARAAAGQRSPPTFRHRGHGGAERAEARAGQADEEPSFRREELGMELLQGRRPSMDPSLVRDASLQDPRGSYELF